MNRVHNLHNFSFNMSFTANRQPAFSERTPPFFIFNAGSGRDCLNFYFPRDIINKN